MPVDAADTKYEYLIIGGTIKAATSSVFSYLSAHPEVCGSSVKETFFFTHEYCGDSRQDLKRYERYFTPESGKNVMVEASPNYLGYKENIAPRIFALLPNARLLFILRNPVDRLYSYYNFAIGKLELPERLAFDDYVDLCEKFASGTLAPESAGIAEKHLRALAIGAYSRYLQDYMAVFPSAHVKVVFFDHLKRDPMRFMADLCGYIGISPDFYRDRAFNKVNVTFSARLKPLHHVAMGINRALESVLRQRPGLKQRLVRTYKRFNQAREGYAPMSDATRARLVEYYAPSNRELKTLLPAQGLPAWIK